MACFLSGFSLDNVLISDSLDSVRFHDRTPNTKISECISTYHATRVSVGLDSLFQVEKMGKNH